ncbi:type II toxin-antitoxin system VapC family toxin [Pseudonocardia sp. GCM10023141]|uniref:type II toxin-antitoxin system VapC family toxin n=1 Tax=Pseudonocardia sp. GCM10023141 TaxID=3252653 RepID=UPI00361A8362
MFSEVSLAFSPIEAMGGGVPRSPQLSGLSIQRGTRTSTLPDFFIGAHAAVMGLRLLTHDAARYRAYYPTVDLIPREHEQVARPVRSGASEVGRVARQQWHPGRPRRAERQLAHADRADHSDRATVGPRSRSIGVDRRQRKLCYSTAGQISGPAGTRRWSAVRR